MVDVSATPEVSAHVTLIADQVASATRQNRRLVGILATASRVRPVPTSRWAYQDPNSNRPATLMKLAEPPLALLMTPRNDRVVNRTRPAVTSEIVTSANAAPRARPIPIRGLIPAASPTAADIASRSAPQPAYCARPCASTVSC